MKRSPKSGDERRCLWCYLVSIVWPFGIPLLSILAEQRGLVELPGLVHVLLMVPGGVIGLHGWGLMQELAERPAEKRPSYYRFLDNSRIRDFPILYLFEILCMFLMC